MIYVENPSLDPYYNLALEEYIFENYKDDDVLMLWRNSDALVCGCYQNIFAETDVKTAAENGIAVLRRISGGGTVYHDAGNLNYTMIKTLRDGEIGYDVFLDEMIGALRKMGINAEKNRICDIVLSGYKISGNSQKAACGRVLHHGTLLYDSDISKLKRYAKGHRDEFNSKSIKSSPFPVANIKEITGMTENIGDFKEKLLENLTDGKYSKLVLREEQIREAEKLRDEKYRSYEWTYGKNPAFSLEFETEYQNKKYKISYTSKKGTVCEISASSQIENISELCGKRLFSDESFDDGLLMHIYSRLV